MSPMLKKVEKAGVQAIKGKRQPNKIDGDDFFSDSNTLRHLYSELINNPEPNRIVMIPSVSYGIANAVIFCKFSQNFCKIAHMSHKHCTCGFSSS